MAVRDVEASARLQAQLHELYRTLEGIDPAAMAPVVRALRAGEDPAPRVGVAGRVKAGKSTLVNALIGRRVARTSAEEATRIVTEYRWGATARAEIVLTDGSRHPVPFTSELPDELPWPADRISHAEVRLPEATLQRYTLIDTPGLSTTTAENEAATRRAMLAGGPRPVDALVYVFRDNEFSDDGAFLRDFAAATSSPGVRSVGVLTHADDFVSPYGDSDPIEQARTYAAALHQRHADDFAAVVPLAGLLAEAATTGIVREADARLLGALRWISAEDLDLRFLPAGTPAEAVEELGARIGEYGLLHGRDVAETGAAALTDWLLAVSGISALIDALAALNIRNEPAGRASAALKSLDAAGEASPVWQRLRHALTLARDHPDLHPVREFEAWQRVSARQPDCAVAVTLRRLLDASDDREKLGLDAAARPDEVRARARDLATQANAAANISTLRDVAAAHRVAARSYTLILTRQA